MLKMYKIRVLLLLAIIFSIASASIAFNIIYVDVNGPNDPGSGTYNDPFRRIQAGINAAANGDTVEIRPGLYTGPGNYNLDPNGKSLTIRSDNPGNANVVNSTIIDPNFAGRGFYIHNGEDTNCVISGLTIKNAYAGDLGAGIYCYKSNSTISHCILMNNYAEEYGGAICCEESNSLFENCIISNNSSYDGGGIECWTASPQLVNCIISNNHSMRYGGGVDCYNRCAPCLVNCDLINNMTEPNGLGGAICLWGSNVSIKNSILWANEAKTGAQLYLQFKSGASVSYCDVQKGILDVCAPDSNINWGSGNIDTDPCFASFDPSGDPNRWDFHLQSEYGRWNTSFYKLDRNNDGIINLMDFAALANVWLQGIDWVDFELFVQYYLANSQDDGWILDESTSPCIDAGDPNSDWSSEPWPNGKRINMGSFGGTSQASKNGNLADFNVDNSVDFADWAIMANQWLTDQPCIEDLNNDGTVNFADISIFAENWLH